MAMRGSAFILAVFAALLLFTTLAAGAVTPDGVAASRKLLVRGGRRAPISRSSAAVTASNKVTTKKGETAISVVNGASVATNINKLGATATAASVGLGAAASNGAVVEQTGAAGSTATVDRSGTSATSATAGTLEIDSPKGGAAIASTFTATEGSAITPKSTSMTSGVGRIDAVATKGADVKASVVTSASASGNRK